ncbi:S8 family serine peptidase [Plantactinospora soyae]|uniref:Subtilisin family serine protease n=1 Tax=Plantactinospora soyae TaxID=1544732 RepID=A0A927QVI8_9ACTN|nr:S8 family serine peptidase [Plantactinospora soyae]MBE1484427.1 subtilisin family serine protease [Plantactinospora soyae]
MRLSRRLRLGVTATAVVVAAGTAAPGSAVAGLSSAPLAVPGPVLARPVVDRAAEHTVTLVTGDRVTVSGAGQVSAQAGPGRKAISFDITTAGGRVRVVPSDAGPLLAAGRLDRRLFDVTGLIEAGYDRRDHLPLIVTGTRKGVDGFTKERDLPVINGMAVRQSRGKAADSWHGLTGGAPSARTLRSGVGKLWLDGMRQPTLDVSVPQTGAPVAWRAGITGRGTTVAVLDSGIDDTHPDLTGQVVGRQNFTEDVEPDNDVSGHGTHVAATIAGTGAASGGRYQGVAPGAKLLDGKVCVAGGCADSWILAGMTWAAADQHAKVVNMSLGGDDDPTVVDPLEEAVQTLSDRYGTLFVISAGNTDGGVVEGAISSPGSADMALTVGAVNDRNEVPGFSRRGPTTDGRLKPDITAPGVDITAARGRDAVRVPGNRGDAYTRLSGTSMAAPHVAGAAAILAQQHPDWPGRQIKATLTASAKPNPGYGAHAQGAGQLDIARAIGQQLSTAPTGVSFGRQLWPHQDDEVLTRDVTYHNGGPTDMPLELTMSTSSPDGAPTPDGMFSVDRTSVVVPAGGDAKVTVTADTRTSGPDGYLGGWLTATSGNQMVQTPLTVQKEVESYDVTLTHTDRNGATPWSFASSLNKRGSDRDWFSWIGPDPGDSVTFRVPKGHYTLTSTVDTLLGTDDSGGKPVPIVAKTLLAQPDLNVDRSMTVELDAQRGKPISVTVPRSSAQQVRAFVSAQTIVPSQTGGTVGMGNYILAWSFANIYTAQLGPDTDDDSFTSLIGGQWAQGNADGSTDNSPYFYSLMFPEAGRLVTGYQRTVADRDLVAVRADFAASRTGTTGQKRIGAGLSRTKSGFYGEFHSFQLPFSRTEFYNGTPGVGATGQFEELSGDQLLAATASVPNIEYGAGRPYQEQWNRAVLAPSLPAVSLDSWEGVRRAGNTIGLDVPMYGDGVGHPGGTVADSFGASLFREGTKIGSTDAARWAAFEVPSAEASYRLELHAERGEPFALSTRTDLAWTFRSGHADPETPAALPLWIVGFSPRVDPYNSTPGGTVQTVPVSVTPQPGSDSGKLVSLTVEASFNDGADWRPVPVRGDSVLVAQPTGRGFVSLRARAADSVGNTVEQTIIRAYRYGPVT